MQDIFIGVDGGGTKTKVRVVDQEGRLLAECLGGAANIRFSVAQAWETILQTITMALQQSQISAPHRLHVGMGLAGCEVKEALHAFLAEPHAFSTLRVVSDAHTACLGAHRCQEGAIIIIGTGIVGYQITQKGCTKISGWGFPYDDQGSGAWLGMQAVGATFESIDKRRAATALTTAIFKRFHHKIDAFVEWVHKANAAEFASLVPLIVQHSEEQDEVAVALLNQAARAVEKIADALHQEAPGLPCSLLGGVAPFIQPWLSGAMQKRVAPSVADACQGAIYLVQQMDA